MSAPLNSRRHNRLRVVYQIFRKLSRLRNLLFSVVFTNSVDCYGISEHVLNLSQISDPHDESDGSKKKFFDLLILNMKVNFGRGFLDESSPNRGCRIILR